MAKEKKSLSRLIKRLVDSFDKEVERCAKEMVKEKVGDKLEELEELIQKFGEELEIDIENGENE